TGASVSRTITTCRPLSSVARVTSVSFVAANALPVTRARPLAAASRRACFFFVQSLCRTQRERESLRHDVSDERQDDADIRQCDMNGCDGAIVDAKLVQAFSPCPPAVRGIAMVTRRRMLQGAGALALLSPLGKGFGHEQAKDAAQLAQQEHAKPAGDGYVPVTDPLVKAKLAQWSDWKFGLILHWGIYSVLGIVESWTLCSEDWIKRPGGVGYVEWKRRYEQLRTQFNPVQFDPAQWAEAAHAAGMRYLVFTTKHHDGFCMFDTAQTDY